MFKQISRLCKNIKLNSLRKEVKKYPSKSLLLSVRLDEEYWKSLRQEYEERMNKRAEILDEIDIVENEISLTKEKSQIKKSQKRLKFLNEELKNYPTRLGGAKFNYQENVNNNEDRMNKGTEINEKIDKLGL